MNDYFKNEPSIYDLWRVITKHKYLFWLVFIIVLIAGVIFLSLRPQKPSQYYYRQYFKVAGYFNEKFIFVQQPMVVANRITNLYWPAVLQQYNSQHKTHLHLQLILNPMQNIGNGKILLKARGTLKDKPVYTELFKMLLAQSIKDNKFWVQMTKDSLTKQLTSLQTQIAIQSDLGNRLKTNLNSKDLSVLNKQITTIGYAGVAAWIESLNTKLQSIQLKLNTLKNSHFTSDFRYSLHALGGPSISRSALIILSAIIAIILGLFAVFIKEFLDNARLANKE